MTRGRRWRGRAGLAAAVALAVSGVLGSAGPAGADATPNPTASWPAPGHGVGTAQTVAGQPATVQAVRRPLILIDRDAEAGRGTSFTLGADVLFATGQDVLSPSASQALQALAQQIIDAGVSGKADVVGHTDDVGSDADNQALSQRRAISVTKRLNELLSGRGITLAAVGRGEKQPLVPNTDAASRSRNRRVSVVFAGVRPASTDASDVAVSGNQPAPSATGTASPGSVVGTTRTITIGSDRTAYTVRIDVTRATRIDSLILVETSAQLLSGKDLYDYDALFTGHTYRDDRHRTALYDRAAGTELPVVVDGTGLPLRSSWEGSISVGTPRHGWMLFPAPSTTDGGLQLYLPAFGVLTVPLAAGHSS